MKKIMVALLAVACTVGFFSACETTAETTESNAITETIETTTTESIDASSTLTFSFDDNGMYTGFSSLPENYTLEDAEKDKYYVMENFEIKANADLWDDFVEGAKSGNDSAIRIVKFYTDDETGPYFIDVFFNQGKYYLFDSSAENQEKQPFKYLLNLTGEFGSPKTNSKVVVLTDNNTLTFKQVMMAMLSSVMPAEESIGQFKIIFLQ